MESVIYLSIIRNKTIRFKFTCAFTLFIIVILCLFAITVYAIFSHRIRQNICKSLLLAAQQTGFYFFDDYGHYLDNVNKLDDDIFSLIAVRIYDNTGKILYTSNNAPAIFPLANLAAVGEFREINNGRYLLYTHACLYDSNCYLLQLYYLLDNEREYLYELFVILLAFIAISVLGSSISAWYLAYFLLQPFRRIAEEASIINAQNLHLKLYHSGVNDEIGSLAATLNLLLDRLYKSFDTLKRFTSNASHELKTPLTIMRGDIEVLLRRERTPGEYKKTLQQTLRELERMSRLVQGLLILAQAESSKADMGMSLISLSKLIADIVAAGRYAVQERQMVTIVSEIAEGIMIYGNEDWIRQIVENLLRNALQYTECDGKIITSLSKQNKKAYITVRNTGSGIQPQHLPFLFENFYRVDEGRSRKKGGFGLGLAICKALTEVHHGKIEVASNLGVDTTFRVILPIVDECNLD